MIVRNVNIGDTVEFGYTAKAKATGQTDIKLRAITISDGAKELDDVTMTEADATNFPGDYTYSSSFATAGTRLIIKFQGTIGSPTYLRRELVIVGAGAAQPTTVGNYCNSNDVIDDTGFSSGDLTNAEMTRILTKSEAKVDKMTGMETSAGWASTTQVTETFHSRDVGLDRKIYLKSPLVSIDTVTVDSDAKTVEDDYFVSIGTPGHIEFVSRFWERRVLNFTPRRRVKEGFIDHEKTITGYDDISIQYTYGASTVPGGIKYLTAAIAGIYALRKIAGKIDSIQGLNSISLEGLTINRVEFKTKIEELKEEKKEWLYHYRNDGDVAMIV